MLGFRVLWSAVVMATLLLFPSPSPAGECQTGERPLNGAEKKFYARLSDIQAYLPQPPEGWRLVDSQIDGPSSICKDGDADRESGKLLLSGMASSLFESQRTSQDVNGGAAVDTTRDFRAYVRISANVDQATFAGTATPVEVKGGSAWRIPGQTEMIPGKPDVVVDGVTIVLLGGLTAVQGKSGLEVHAKTTAGAPYTNVQNVLIEIRADGPRAEQILKDMYVEQLSRLLQS